MDIRTLAQETADKIRTEALLRQGSTTETIVKLIEYVRNKCLEEVFVLAENAYYRSNDRNALPGWTEPSYGGKKEEIIWSEPIRPYKIAERIRGLVSDS